MDVQKICEIVLEELENLIQNPAEKKLADKILLVKHLQQNLRATATKKISTTSQKNDVITTPFENEIITLDDFEFQDDEKISCNEGVFKNLNLLENHPAHLAIFIQYLISYATSNPILFHLICKSVLKLDNSEFLPAVYSLYCNFLDNDAPLKIDVENSSVDKLFSCLKISNSSDVHREITKLLEVSLHHNERYLQKLLKEFNSKRAIGLGIFYGEQYLHDKLDERTCQLIIEDTVWRNFEKKFLDSSNEVNSCLAASLASVLRILNFQPRANKDYLDICSNFFQNKRSRSSSKEKLSFLTLYGHNCENISFPLPTHCFCCSKLVCNVGNVGYSCKNCKHVFHKICMQLDSRVCSKNSDSNNNRNQSWINSNIIENYNTDPNEAIEASTESNQSSKIKVFCRVSIDPVRRKNVQFCVSDLECDEPANWEQAVDSSRLSTMTSADKRRQDAINEFFTTESYHVRSLKIIFNVYYIPMCANCSEDFVRLVFPNLSTLIQIHVGLNEDLKTIKKTSKNGIISELADVLVKNFTGQHGECLEESTALFCQKQ